MITAVDTNILLDVLMPDLMFRDQSRQALANALATGSLVISEPVYAELAVRFEDQDQLDRFLADSRVEIDSSSARALFQAGQAWGEYARRRPRGITCPSCGLAQGVNCTRCGSLIQPRQHMIADFVIGAHARLHADRLLTRDRGYYSTYFPDLELI